MMRARLAISALAVALTAAAGDVPFQSPRFTRDQMEAAIGPRDRWLVVYGTRDPTVTATLRERGRMIARRLVGEDSTRVRADRDLDWREIGGAHLFLLGGPRVNEWTRRLEPALPVRFTPRGFRWFGRAYEDSGDVIHLVYPHPLAPRRFLFLIAANSRSGVARRGAFGFGGEDWKIYRKGSLARSGVFAQSPERPWRYDPALDHDREADRDRFVAALTAVGSRGIVIRAPPGLATGPILERSQALLARLDRMGLSSRGGVSLTLYASLEQKGNLTHNTRPEHLDLEAGSHAALPPGRAEPDLWSVPAARLLVLGGSPESRFLEPAGVWLSGRFEGEPLERSVRRLYEGRLLPTARDAASIGTHWRSPLIRIPSRALLSRAVWECAPAGRRGSGREALIGLLKSDPPGTLDSLCARLGLSSRSVERRYAELADSIARAGARVPDRNPPRPWRPEDGFQRGVCLAHAVSLEQGYLSSGCARELETLSGLGVNWVSLTPFGYLPDSNRPEIYPSAEGGVDGESDEAICAAAAYARAVGIRVWLKPHLWTRGWIGDLAFSPSGWGSFFDAYHEFLMHYALLAQREGMDGLVVGHELPTATLRFPDRWRTLIADVRRVYSGTLTYDAHWDRELSGLVFWDALDLIGVSFYAPLADRPSRPVRELAAGADRALDRVREVAVRWRKPLALLEVGYAPARDAPLRPWEEGAGPPDLETQRRCYQAIIRGAESESWIAGIFWWKWFSTSGIGGPADASFTPRGKPAEAELRRAYAAWRRRAVQAPRR